MLRLLPFLFLVSCGGTLRIPGPLGGLGRHRGIAAPPPGEAIVDEPAAAPARNPSPPAPFDGLGPRVARAARHYLNHELDGFRNDCSGFVAAATARAGRPLTGNTASLWAMLDDAGATHRRRRPAPGDLAFFDDTYDRNRNGRADDDLTHVAVVLEVLDDGTIVLAHGGTSAGRSAFRMNLHHPHEHVRDGVVLNDPLRRRRSTDRPGTRYLAGELWRGFATLPDEDDG